MGSSDFDAAVDSYRQALGAFFRGDPGPVADHFSRRDDVTLANPLGLPRVGRAEVEQGIAAASANFEDGSVQFEELARFSTADLGYVVYLERANVRLVGTDETVPSSLRVTMVFRREGGTWKVAHRHADPITSVQPIETVLDAST